MFFNIVYKCTAGDLVFLSDVCSYLSKQVYVVGDLVYKLHVLPLWFYNGIKAPPFKEGGSVQVTADHTLTSQ